VAALWNNRNQDPAWRHHAETMRRYDIEGFAEAGCKDGSMTETKRFCWALAAAAFSLAVLALVATSADQRQGRHPTVSSAPQTIGLN
jgi:hypothetical protein